MKRMLTLWVLPLLLIVGAARADGEEAYEETIRELELAIVDTQNMLEHTAHQLREVEARGGSEAERLQLQAQMVDLQTRLSALHAQITDVRDARTAHEQEEAARRQAEIDRIDAARARAEDLHAEYEDLRAQLEAAAREGDLAEARTIRERFREARAAYEAARKALAQARAARDAMGEGRFEDPRRWLALGELYRSLRPEDVERFRLDVRRLDPRGPHAEAAGRIEHLRAAAGHLREAGMVEQAERLELEAQEIERRLAIAAWGDSWPSPTHGRDVLQAVEGLRHEVRALREEIRELKELLLRDR
ncbi:MAG: hypothetical protein ACYTG6_01265 [Planctomycetota bacterium]|jgi:DNA repair exonuclease SbcCD ATPase subunit